MKWIVLRELHRGVSLGIVCNSFKCKERKGFAKDAMKVVEFEIFLKFWFYLFADIQMVGKGVRRKVYFFSFFLLKTFAEIKNRSIFALAIRK